MFDSRPQWHLMVKTPEGRSAIRRLRGADPARIEDLLHWTVLPLGPGYDQFAAAIRKALAEIDLLPFTIQWDSLVAAGRHVSLKPKQVPREVTRLRQAIRRAFAKAGIPLLGDPSRPHLSLNYNWDGPAFEEDIEPIVWRVTDVLLIESLTGQADHAPHGEFPLIPRQGMLFPLTRCSAVPA